MGKSVNDGAADAYLNYIKTNANEMVLCSQEPTTYAEATSTYALADVPMASGDFVGPVDHAGGGRQITVSSKSSVGIDVAGTTNHVAIAGSVSSVNTLLCVTTCPATALSVGSPVNITSWMIFVEDPV